MGLLGLRVHILQSSSPQSGSAKKADAMNVLGLRVQFKFTKLKCQCVSHTTSNVVFCAHTGVRKNRRCHFMIANSWCSKSRTHTLTITAIAIKTRRFPCGESRGTARLRITVSHFCLQQLANIEMFHGRQKWRRIKFWISSASASASAITTTSAGTGSSAGTST